MAYQYEIKKDLVNYRVNVLFAESNSIMQAFFNEGLSDLETAYAFALLTQRTLRKNPDTFQANAGWSVNYNSPYVPGPILSRNGQVQGHLSMETMHNLLPRYIQAVLECWTKKPLSADYNHRFELDPTDNRPRLIFSESEQWCKDHPKARWEERENPLSVVEKVLLRNFQSVCQIMRFREYVSRGDYLTSRYKYTVAIDSFCRKGAMLQLEVLDNSPTTACEIPLSVFLSILEELKPWIVKCMQKMQYTYRLETDVEEGRVRVIFTENGARNPGERCVIDDSLLRGAEGFWEQFLCYEAPEYLNELERYLQLGRDYFRNSNFTNCYGMRICEKEEEWMGIHPGQLFPDGCVMLIDSCLPKPVFTQLLQDFQKALADCCDQHLQWLKDRPYSYTVRWDDIRNRAVVVPTSKFGDVNHDFDWYIADYINEVRYCLRADPEAYSPTNNFRSRKQFAYLFRKDWVVFGNPHRDYDVELWYPEEKPDYESIPQRRCLPLNVFQKIAEEINRVEAEHSVSPYEKRLNRQWRQVQLSGKMWPMP